MPPRIARFLLRNNLIITPGRETREPGLTAQRYQEDLEGFGVSLGGKRIMLFGYGGSYAMGCHLLRRGAGHVVMCDKYAPPDSARNNLLLPEFAEYLIQQGDQVIPRAESITILQADIREVSLEKVDIVLSSSVYEHLDDVDGITRALAGHTKHDGLHLHYINLRDHFPKYPFEMLTYSESTWRNWLNPTSNLNRLRAPVYGQVFERYFRRVEMKTVATDLEAFENARPRIQPEFLTGDPQIDAIAVIWIFASMPRTLP